MQTLRSLGWLVDFIVGSLLWSIAIVLAAFLAPFALVGFFPLADLLQLIVSVRFRTGSSGIGQAGGGRFSQSRINFVLWNHSSRTPSRQGTGRHSSVQVDSETGRVPGEQILAVVLVKRRFQPALLPGATQNRTLENSASNFSSRFLGASRLEPLGASLFRGVEGNTGFER
jgi:hypothetical protein